MLSAHPTCYRFGAFHLDAESGELQGNGGSVRLQPQPLQVLLELLRHPGRIVTREDFQASLWPGNTYVEFDDGLNHAIRRLRIALGDTAEVARYIETIPRRGYRFVAAVETQAPAPREAVPGPAVESRPAMSGRLWWMVVAATTLVAALTIGFFYTLRRRPTEASIEALAVLPFANFSSDPEQEHLADAITEEITTDLSRIKTTRVISRTSAMRMKGTKLSLREIGRELGVDAVVEGSVQRAGDRVRIAAQLVRVQSERHLWAEAYERSLKDILLVRSEVSADIASHVRAEVAPHEPPPAKGRAAAPEAYDSYLIGMRFFDEGTMTGYKKSIPYFEEATEKDPDYALAYAELAEAHAMIAFLDPSDSTHFGQAQAAARKAMEIDPTLPEAQIREADLKLYWGWDWSQCDGPMRQAAQEGTGSSDAQSHYALCLEVLGRYQEALPYAENARRIDPLSGPGNRTLGRLLARNGQAEKGLEYLYKAKDLDPNNAATYEILAWSYDKQNRQREAVEARIRAGRLRDDLPEGSEEALTNAFNAGGIAAFEQEQRKFLRKRIESLKQQPDTPPLRLAALYVKTGDFNEAFYWLEKGFQQQHTPILVWLKSGIAWEPLRKDPRYHALLSKMKMPE